MVILQKVGVFGCLVLCLVPRSIYCKRRASLFPPGIDMISTRKATKRVSLQPGHDKNCHAASIFCRGLRRADEFWRAGRART
jgi:hypothetical protein